MTGKLLDPALAGRLEKYRLVRTLPVPDGYAGGRRSPRKGGAVEFADYREYAPGDEPRRVDWKAYARLGRLYVKEYLDEKQDAVLFIIDTSASMDWGSGDEHKGRYALRLAAGLGTCVLAGSDRLAVVTGSGPVPDKSSTVSPGAGDGGSIKDTVNSEALTDKRQPVRALAPSSGRQSLPRLWQWLGETAFTGGTDLPGCLRKGFKLQPGTTGLYVFSDLLDPAGVDELLRLAAGQGVDITLLHILAPGELEPPGEGEWTMVDAETGERVEVSLTPAALADYGARLNSYIASLESSCRRWNARRVQLSTAGALPDVLLRELPQAGVLRN